MLPHNGYMPNQFDPYRDRYAHRAAGMSRSEIRELFAVLQRPEIISLAGGNTDTSIVSHRVTECVELTLSRYGSEALGYGIGEGHPVLREALTELMALEGIRAQAHQIVVTDGAQQGLELLAKIFCEPGDLILTEGPTYVGALGAFDSFQADVRTVPTDEHGVIPDALAEYLDTVAADGRRAKFLYLVPTFQNPSGTTLSAERRPEVISICRARDVLIIEDNPYAQVRFEGEPVPPLRSLTDEGIIYLGTLSKVFSPGMRVGWLVAPETIRERFVLAKEAADLCSSPFTQLVAATYLTSGHVPEDLEMTRKIYKERRDAMLDALDAYFPPGTTARAPEGGLFLWATLPKPIDTKAMRAQALEGGAAYVSGTAFYPDKRQGRQSMRLNFSYPSLADIEEGMRRLGRVAHQELEFATSLEG